MLTEAKTREFQQLQRENKQLQIVHDQVVVKNQQLQCTLQEKERETISDLKQTISVHERKIQQLEQQDNHAGSRLPQHSAAPKVPQAAVVPAVQRNITQLRWGGRKEGTRENAQRYSSSRRRHRLYQPL